ncbi:MAG: DUF1844 domain-containing protein [Planctomycetota bacterium]
MSAAGEPEPTFQALLLQLATQVMIDLGEIPNPFTQRAVTDLRRARRGIGLLRMLEEKTEGNLDEAEERAMANLLAEIDEKWAEKGGEDD